MSPPNDLSRHRAVARGKSVVRALAAMAVLLAACSAPPPTVDRITIVNPTEYAIDVHVSGREQDLWLPVGIVDAHTEDVTEQVIDQGDRWTFRFLFSGDPVEQVSLTRPELERSGWRVVIPDELGERLRELGEPPSD